MRRWIFFRRLLEKERDESLRDIEQAEVELKRSRSNESDELDQALIEEEHRILTPPGRAQEQPSAEKLTALCAVSAASGDSTLWLLRALGRGDRAGASAGASDGDAVH